MTQHTSVCAFQVPQAAEEGHPSPYFDRVRLAEDLTREAPQELDSDLRTQRR